MENRQAIFNYLKQDPLRNIMLLKMLAAYEGAIKAVHITVEKAAGVLMLLPPHKSRYDSQTYPTAKFVVFISADNTAVTNALLPHIPRNGDLVFKLFREEDVGIVRQVFPLQRQRGFISFTTTSNRTFNNHEEVAILSDLDERLLPLFHKNSYSTEEVQQWFAAKQGIGFAIYRQDRPVSAGMAFQNYANIWEIGGLHTAVFARRQGHAQKIVETALHTLHQQNKITRYQCHEANGASRHLAKKTGLEPFLHTEHYLYIG